MRLVGLAYLSSGLAVNLLVLLDPLRQVQIGEHPNTLWGLRPAQLPYGHSAVFLGYSTVIVRRQYGYFSVGTVPPPLIISFVSLASEN